MEKKPFKISNTYLEEAEVDGKKVKLEKVSSGFVELEFRFKDEPFSNESFDIHYGTHTYFGTASPPMDEARALQICQNESMKLNQRIPKEDFEKYTAVEFITMEKHMFAKLV